MKNYPGHLLVTEGIDGSGKTTQARLLYKWLKSEGYDTILTNEPWREGLRPQIKRLIGDDEGNKMSDPSLIALSFATDRRYHCVKELIPALEAGKVIVCDRYYYSSFAYQVTDGLELEWVKTLNETAITPDLCLFIDIPVEVSLQRLWIRWEKSESDPQSRYERGPFLEKLRENYHSLFKDFDEMVLIDGDRLERKVFSTLKDVVREYLGQ